MSKTIFIKEIGEISLVKSKRSKRMRILVNSLAEVKVSIPYTYRYKDAEQFIIEKRKWINRTVSKIKETVNKRTIFSDNSTFNTFSHIIKFKKNDSLNHQITLTIEKEFAYITYPSNSIIESKEHQAAVRSMIDEVLRYEAKRYLPYRVKYFAEKYNLTYNKVTVRKAKTRWGSCSGKNNISLNIHLMLLPQHLSDYVILHELAHTIEKNHLASFWNFLDNLTDGKAKYLSNQLKKYSTSVI